MSQNLSKSVSVGFQVSFAGIGIICLTGLQEVSIAIVVVVVVVFE